MDGTPIYDIKPYLAYVDSHPEAAGGFTDQIQDHKLKVEFPEKLLKKIPEKKKSTSGCPCKRSKTWDIRKTLKENHGMSLVLGYSFKVDGEQLQDIGGI